MEMIMPFGNSGNTRHLQRVSSKREIPTRMEGTRDRHCVVSEKYCSQTVVGRL